MFQPGDTIIEFIGDIIHLQELNRRYNIDEEQYTAPYALQVRQDTYIDPACNRGVGGLANHKPRGRGANADFRQIKERRRGGAVIGIKLVATRAITCCVT